MPMLGLLLTTTAAQAQDEVGEFLRAGRQDANKLLGAYVEPASKSLGHSLNGGWFNSGKAMKLGRFDVRVFATGAVVPDKDKTFDLQALGLTQVKVNPGNSIAPTVLGNDQEGPELTLVDRNPLNGRDEEIAKINSPQGAGFSFLPVPMAQVSLGLVKDTEIAVRFSPKVKFDDFEGELWGVGLKHGIKQWIPVISMIPGFDITVFGGYTNLKSAYRGIDVQLATRDRVFASSQQLQEGYYDNQVIRLTTKAWTGSLVASKTLSVLTAYAGVRYSNIETDLNAEGRYPVVAYRTTAPYTKYVEDLENPVTLNMKDSQWGATAGLRLKLAFFSLYGEYTLSKYSTASAGIGLGFN
ncbi:DUF6588 family protein [Rufibacter immobilis]|uniref:DUF6588 family protein n=1 Tax=Rufibacter immobilis TaxID=1348778 RepID=UPI0035EB65A5